jgi:hypothetical protein
VEEGSGGWEGDREMKLSSRAQMAAGGGKSGARVGAHRASYRQASKRVGQCFIVKDTTSNMSWVQRLGLGGLARKGGVRRHGVHARHVACAAP